MRLLSSIETTLISGCAKKAEGTTTANRTTSDECSFWAFVDPAIGGAIGGGAGGAAFGGGGSGALKGGVTGAIGGVAYQDYQCAKQVYKDGREYYHLISGQGVQPDDPIQRNQSSH